MLDKFVERLADRHRSDGLLVLFALCRGDDLRRQIARQDQLLFAQRAGALDRILQFAHVSGIIVMAKNIDRFRIDLLRFAAGHRRLLLQEMIHEQRHVFESFAERRDFHRNNREPVIQVLAERSVL